MNIPTSSQLYWENFETLLDEFRRDPAISVILTDFDGTISEIVPDYGGARIIPEAREVLTRLAADYPLYIVSGRMAADVANLVGIPGIVYVGVHGLEWMDRGAAEAQPDPRVAPYRDAVREAAARLEREPLLEQHGLVLEDKVWMLGIHWRPAVEAGGEAETLAGLAKRLAREAATGAGLKVREGRMVVELMPPVEANKGTGVEFFIHRDKLERALYAGDDRTDIDAFTKLEQLEGEGGFKSLEVAVTSDEAPAELIQRAHVVLPEPAAVAPFLRPLLL